MAGRTGPAALQRVSDAGGVSLSLILCDVNMPEMNGLELLPKAKALRPDVPVIMIAAYGDADTKRKALENGAEALLDVGVRKSSPTLRLVCPTLFQNM